MTISTDQRFFRGRTLKIHSVSRVDVLVEMPFDLFVCKTFTLDALGFDDSAFDDDTYSDAQHALVVLLGGKRVIVEPDISQRAHWGHLRTITARIYLDARVHGAPVGLTKGILSNPVLEISPFFSWVAENKFNMGTMKRVLNGNGGKHG